MVIVSLEKIFEAVVAAITLNSRAYCRPDRSRSDCTEHAV